MNEELEALIVQSQRNTKDTNDTLEALIVQTGKLDNKAELEAITKSSINTKDVIEKGNTELVAGNKSIVEAIKNLKPEPIDGVDVTGLVTTLMKLLKSKDGEDGYTPVKGKDYYTDEEIKAVITEIVAGIRVPKDGEDGYTPIKGKDYFDGKKGEPGKPGKDGEDADEIDYDKVLNLVIKKLPKVEKIKEKTTDEIAEELKGKLSYEDLKDLPDLFRKISSKNYSFAELTDTPQDYKGNKGRFLKVNEEEDGLEYGDGDGVGDMLKAVYDPANKKKPIAFADEIVSVQSFELELSRKVTGNSYMEMVNAGGKLTGVNYWSASNKTTKLFTKTLTYTGDKLTSVSMKDEATGKILTSTLAYTGDSLTSVTKVIS